MYLRSSLSNLGRKTNSGELRGEVSNPSHQKRVTAELSVEGVSQPRRALGGEGLGNSLNKVWRRIKASWAHMKISGLWARALKFRRLV